MLQDRTRREKSRTAGMDMVLDFISKKFQPLNTRTGEILHGKISTQMFSVTKAEFEAATAGTRVVLGHVRDCHTERESLGKQ